MNKNVIAHIVSFLAVGFYLFQFWWPGTIGSGVLWGLAAACAIYSVHEGARLRGKAEKTEKWMLDTAFVLGCIVLIGLAISASVLLVPAIM